MFQHDLVTSKSPFWFEFYSILSLSAKNFDDRERCLKLQSYHEFIPSHTDCIKNSKFATFFVQQYRPRSSSNCKHSFIESRNNISQLIPKFLKNNSFGFEVSLMVSQARFIWYCSCPGPSWSGETIGSVRDRFWSLDPCADPLSFIGRQLIRLKHLILKH